MKKVLIISTHFAPDAHVGAKRIIKFCKYLPQYGWQPIVLTSDISDYHRLDETLMDQLPEDLEIHRVKKWHIFPQNDEREQPSANFSSDRETIDYGLFRRIAGKLIHSVEFMDYSWLFPALIRCSKIIRRHNIDVIFSSSPNSEAHLVPLFLSINNRIDWVAEYRDPWTTQAFFDSTAFLKKKIQRFLELAVLKKVSNVIVVSKSLLNGIHSANRTITSIKGHLIYNGFDPEDFSHLFIKQTQNKQLEMSFVGTFGYHIQPGLLLKALANLIGQNPIYKKRLRLRFIGEVKEWNVEIDIDKKMRNAVIDLGISEIVKFIPFKSYCEALKSMLNTNVLIFIIGSDPDSPGVTDGRVTAKIFEYLYAKRPILALVPSQSEVARILKDCNAGYIVPYGDIELTVKILKQIWEDYDSGRLTKWNFNEKEIEKYDRRKQTKQLADIFNEVITT